MLVQSFTFHTRHALGGPRDLPVRLGVETYGTLDAARGNAVLVCHYYTGTMRAAGTPEGGTPGWWDALIGPGKPVDTDRFFVVCMNTPANVQARDPGVVTTGPDTLDEDGVPYGDRFPPWTFAELWDVQCRLMHHLGVARWHAVIGPSLGGMQALQWAARAPELAPRVAAIATSPRAGVTLRGAFMPLLHDLARCGGLPSALRLITFFGLGSDGLHRTFDSGDADAVDRYLTERGATASLAHVLDIGRLVTTHDLAQVAPLPDLAARWRDHQLRLLTVNVVGDQFFPGAEMRQLASLTSAAGVCHEHLEIESDLGHLACVAEPHKFETSLRRLLQS